ncbi:PREDICTED: LOC110745843, partial [Prunus dulcis]
ESFECRLAETKEPPEQQADNPRTGGTANNPATEQLCFSKPTREMANHLRPLFITAILGGIPISKIMIDG